MSKSTRKMKALLTINWITGSLRSIISCSIQRKMMCLTLPQPKSYQTLWQDTMEQSCVTDKQVQERHSQCSDLPITISREVSSQEQYSKYSTRSV